MPIENLNIPKREIAVPKRIAVVVIAAQKFGALHSKTHEKQCYLLRQTALAAQVARGGRLRDCLHPPWLAQDGS